MATFNSLVLALDGSTFKPLWNVTFEGCQSLSSAAVGRWDSDEVPDFMVTYHCRDRQKNQAEEAAEPEYPLYQYAKVKKPSLS